MGGAAIVTVHTSQAVETDSVSSNLQLKSSGSDTLLPGVAAPSSQFKNAENAKADPVEAIKPYPMRMVRVRTSKEPLAGIPLGRTTPPEPPASAGPASPENAEAPGSPAALLPAQSVAAAKPAVSGTKKRRSAVHARSQRDNENENARWQGRRGPYWNDRGYAEVQYWHGAYRNWVY